MDFFFYDFLRNDANHADFNDRISFIFGLTFVFRKKNLHFFFSIWPLYLSVNRFRSYVFIFPFCPLFFRIIFVTCFSKQNPYVLLISQNYLHSFDHFHMRFWYKKLSLSLTSFCRFCPFNDFWLIKVKVCKSISNS